MCSGLGITPCRSQRFLPSTAQMPQRRHVGIDGTRLGVSKAGYRLRLLHLVFQIQERFVFETRQRLLC